MSRMESTIMECIDHCHIIMEESRRRLNPLVTQLEQAERRRDDRKRSNLNSSNMAVQGNDLEQNNEVSDSIIVGMCLHGAEDIFGAVNTLMIRLADFEYISIEDEMVSINNIYSQNEHHFRAHIEQEANVYLLMASSCIHKACDFVTSHFLKLAEADSISFSSSGPLDDELSNKITLDEEDKIKIQPSMARLAELSLRLMDIQRIFSLVRLTHNGHDRKDEDSNGNDNEEDDIISSETIIDAYAQYQRRCLRARSKPSISSLAELRRVASSQHCFVSDILEQERIAQQIESGIHIQEDIEGEDDSSAIDGERTVGHLSRAQPHAKAVTVVLGEASSLIQPLVAWRDALLVAAAAVVSEEPKVASNKNAVQDLLRQLCQEAIDILDMEAQTLAVTVGSWFTSDQHGISLLQQLTDFSNLSESIDLISIEAALEEMAFLCQVLSRYALFSQQIIGKTQGLSAELKHSSKLRDLLAEQSLHYSTLETRLATLQFNKALSLASPQLIEIGRPRLYVPSVVEDAHFVCVKAVERAAGTRSERAVWTVGHWVCEVWGIDNGIGVGSVKGVYQALMEGIGCSGVSDATECEPVLGLAKVGVTRSKIENSFATSLMEAVDGEIGVAEVKQSAISPPLSGGVLSNFTRKQSMNNNIDTELCLLNGISAAEKACSALSRLFTDLVEERLDFDSINTEDQKKASMLVYAGDELASHSSKYNEILRQRACALVSAMCGPDEVSSCEKQLCLQNLRLFFNQEIYHLDASSFRGLDNDDRLQVELINPIRKSQIFDDIRKDKCDRDVVLQISEAISKKSTEIILQIIFEGYKEFNDWGALLLSKQIRLLQNTFCGLLLEPVSSSENDTKALHPTARKPELSATNTATILKQFERVNQVVSVLQLEKPSDWLAFAYKLGESDKYNLNANEIRKVMALRVDFSEDAIAKVYSQMTRSK